MNSPISVLTLGFYATLVARISEFFRMRHHKKTSFTLPEDSLKKLRQLAKEEQRSQSNMVDVCIQRAWKNRKKNGNGGSEKK